MDENIEGNVFNIFGRCPYFIVAEIKNGKINKTDAIKNESVDQNSGAGVSTAQLIAENNIDVIITGNIGPRALDVLKQFNIEIYFGEGIIKNILQDFIEKKLKKIN